MTGRSERHRVLGRVKDRRLNLEIVALAEVCTSGSVRPFRTKVSTGFEQSVRRFRLKVTTHLRGMPTVSRYCCRIPVKLRGLRIGTVEFERAANP
jgi:hypothetical protein